MTDSPTPPTKASVRAEIRAARASRQGTQDEAQRLSEQLGQLCLDQNAAVVAAYLPLDGEPDITAFLDWAKAQRIRLIMPVVTGQSLRWVYFESDTRFGELGFEEAVGKPAELSTAEIIFTPALSVDLQGNRLGQGKGFYDRALQQIGNSRNRAKLVAVVFDEEIRMSLPTEAHDQKVNAAVTASKLIWFQH